MVIIPNKIWNASSTDHQWWHSLYTHPQSHIANGCN